MATAAVEVSGLTKAFGTNRVLRGIDLELHKGEITVLMGPNGAGKSTLVKVICGVHPADSGTIRLNGKSLQAQTPSEAINAGIVTVHQSINDGVIPDLDVASNLMLDALSEPGSGFFLKRKKIREGSPPVSLAIHRDEVIAVTGLVGAGKSELAGLLFGLASPAGGTMRLEGKPFRPKSPRHAIDQGVFLCPKDRASNSVLPDHSIVKNTTIPFLSRYSTLSFLNRQAEAKPTRNVI